MNKQSVRPIAHGVHGLHDWRSRGLLLGKPDELSACGSGGSGSSGGIAAAIKILEDSGAKQLPPMPKDEADALFQRMDEQARKTFEKFSRARRETLAKADGVVLDQFKAQCLACRKDNPGCILAERILRIPGRTVKGPIFTEEDLTRQMDVYRRLGIANIETWIEVNGVSLD